MKNTLGIFILQRSYGKIKSLCDREYALSYKQVGREEIMTFYQELQLNQAGSKALIRSCTDKKEKMRHTAIYLLKIFITMVFAWL